MGPINSAQLADYEIPFSSRAILMDDSKSKEMSLLEILKKHTKTDDIVKCGVNPASVYSVCRDLACPPTINKLDQHRISYELHIKYGIPQANVKTLMNLAQWYVNKYPELITDAHRRHSKAVLEKESKKSLEEETSELNAQPSSDIECVQLSADSCEEPCLPPKKKTKRIIITSSDGTDHEHDPIIKNGNHNASASSSSATIVDLSDDDAAKMQPKTAPIRKKRSLHKKRELDRSDSDESDDEKKISPMKKRSEGQNSRTSYMFDAESEESDISLPEITSESKGHSLDRGSKKISTVDMDSDESDVSEPVIPKKRGRPISGGKGRKNAKKQAPGRKSKKVKDDAEGTEWDVVAILGHTIEEGTKKYKVQWKLDDRGEYWSEDLNWVKECDMMCEEMVKEYEESVLSKNEVREAPSREDLEERTLSVKELREKRQRENMEKTKLLISDDKDICTSSGDEAVRRGRYAEDVVDAIETCRRRRRN